MRLGAPSARIMSPFNSRWRSTAGLLRQRGTNENIGGVLRQFFPKRTDSSAYSQGELEEMALRLNQRPRKTLGLQIPAAKLQASVAGTH
jgi:IS30 family transposase